MSIIFQDILLLYVTGYSLSFIGLYQDEISTFFKLDKFKIGWFPVFKNIFLFTVFCIGFIWFIFIFIPVGFRILNSDFAYPKTLVFLTYGLLVIPPLMIHEFFFKRKNK